MAGLDHILKWFTAAASNTNIANIGIQGTNLVSNFDNAEREMMAEIALGLVTRAVTKTVGTYTALLTDHNQFWRCTGAVEIDLTAAATLTTGWCLWIRANGGAVTIDPNGSETIDGSATSLVLADGQTVLIVCTGTAFFTVMGGSASGEVQLPTSATPTPTREGSLAWDSDDNHFAAGDGTNTLKPGKPPTVQVFSAGGTWTKPAGCRYAVFEAVGGGGGSGACNGQGGGTAMSTGGGGSGFYGQTALIDVTATVSAAVAIGAAGAAGVVPNGNGGNGGNTTITISATTYTWGGGNASTGNIAGGTVGGSDGGGAGGIGTNVVGGSWPGGPSIYTTDNFSGGTGTMSNATAGNGGSNPLGRGGVGGHTFTPTTSVAAVAGTGFGAGASGCAVLQSTGDVGGAAGTAGYMRVWEYY